MANRRYITLETAPELIGKTVDCFKRMGHFYPLRVIQMGEDGLYFVVDRGGTSFHPETCYGCRHFDGIDISRPPQSWCYVEEDDNG